MEDPGLVLRFPDGRVADFRSWPIKVLDSDGTWRPAENSDGSSEGLNEAVVLSAAEIASIDKASKSKSA